MVVELKLTRFWARLAFGVLSLAACLLLVVIIIARFVIGTLADDRVAVTRDMLVVPVEYFPGSARLNARLAAAELSESDRDLASAGFHARRAADLSPHDYRFRLILAQVQEAEDDRAGAEQSLEAARALAPNYWNVHYRLGNLLVREGKLAQSVDELRLAVSANGDLLPGTLDLVWRASHGDVSAVQTVAGSGAKARLTLAGFLLKMSRATEAVEVFSGVPRGDRLASATDSSAFLNALVAAAKLEAARGLWSEMAGAGPQTTLVWNGGFESDFSKDFSQFDWSFGRSDYARLAIDTAVAHSGSRSLRIEFAGRDTTRLDNEIRQLVLVRPGASYILECYAKTREMATPEGPRVVVTDGGSWIAASEPVPGGSNDWQRLTVSFTAPASASGSAAAVFVSVKRKPKFSYDEPTRGTVWLDDFSMNEQ